MRIAIASGKGGTGKTCVVAAFAALAGGAVLSGCDGDAADLHLVLRPALGAEHPFSGCSQADLNPDLSATITEEATVAGAEFVATVDYDPAVTYAQVESTDVIAYGGRAATEIAKVWEAVSAALSPSLEGGVIDG